MTAPLTQGRANVGDMPHATWWAALRAWLRKLTQRVRVLPEGAGTGSITGASAGALVFAQYHEAGSSGHAPSGTSTAGRSAMVFRRDEDADRPGVSLRQAADDTARSSDSEQFTPINRGEFYAHLPGAQPAGEQPGQAAGAGQISVIAADATWTGTLVTTGSVHVLGAVHGDRIEAERLEVARGASVDATIVVGTCSISGMVDGAIECRERLAVTGSGIVRGSIVAGTLTVDEGAVIVGRLRMRDSFIADQEDATGDSDLPEG